MKKIILSLIFASLVIVGCSKGGKNSHETNTTEQNGTFQKQGFLTTKWCAEQGMFQDCRMESILCGEGECYKKWEVGDEEKIELVLYSHDDLKYYKLDLSHFKDIGSLLEEGINKNQVTINGDAIDNNNTIIVKAFGAPPPPPKSFFKGCL